MKHPYFQKWKEKRIYHYEQPPGNHRQNHLDSCHRIQCYLSKWWVAAPSPPLPKERVVRVRVPLQTASQDPEPLVTQRPRVLSRLLASAALGETMQSVFVSPLCPPKIDVDDPLSPGDGPVSIPTGTNPAWDSVEIEIEF